MSRALGFLRGGLLGLAFLVLCAAADAQTAACSGAGTVTGPGSFSSAQTWVTDSADSFNQQTNALNAVTAERGCTRTDQWGRQSSSVGFVLGSCSDASRDGTYTWADAAHPCDMSLPLATGGGGPSAWPADVVAWAVTGYVLLFITGLAVGMVHASIIRLAESTI